MGPGPCDEFILVAGRFSLISSLLGMGPLTTIFKLVYNGGKFGIGYNKDVIHVFQVIKGNHLRHVSLQLLQMKWLACLRLLLFANRLL